VGLVERWVATRQGNKPRDVEEVIDYHWHRPLAGLLVQLIEHWPITPNQVTLLSGLMSLLAGIAIGFGYFMPWLVAVGGVLLFASIILDCADGQLARVRGTYSELGRALDGLVDGMAPLSVFHGMAFFMLREQPFIVVWPIAAVTVSSLVWHAVSYDAAKNVFLHCSRPDFSLGGDTLIVAETMRQRVQQLRAQGKKGDAWLMWIWSVWTGPQNKQLAPWLERARSPQNEAERELFNRMFRPLMHLGTWLGFGTHLFILTLGALAAPFDARAIWVAWAILAGPLNVIAIYLAIVRPRRERSYIRALEALRA
jgi:phosphatidylglycerophosphate synthase